MAQATAPKEVFEWLACQRQHELMSKQAKVASERKKSLEEPILSWLQQNEKRVQLVNFSPEEVLRYGPEGTLRIKSTTDYTPCSLKHIDQSLTDLLKEFFYKEILPLIGNGGINFDALPMPVMPQNMEGDEEDLGKMDKESRFWRFQGNAMAGKIWQRLPIRQKRQTIDWYNADKKMEEKMKRQQRKEELQALQAVALGGAAAQQDDAMMDGGSNNSQQPQQPLGYRTLPRKYKTQQERLTVAVGQAPLPSPPPPPAPVSTPQFVPPAPPSHLTAASLANTFGPASFNFNSGGGGGSSSFFAVPNSSSSILAAKKY